MKSPRPKARSPAAAMEPSPWAGTPCWRRAAMRCSPASAARHRSFTLKQTAGARACLGRRACDGPNGTGRPGGNPGAPEALARPGGPPARLTLATGAEARPPAANAIQMVRVTAQPVAANLLGSMPSLGWATFHAAIKQETTGKEAESKTRNAWRPNEGLMMGRRLPRISGQAAFALPSGQQPLRTSHGVWPGSDPCAAAALLRLCGGSVRQQRCCRCALSHIAAMGRDGMDSPG
jgi:hypothetical protein